VCSACEYAGAHSGRNFDCGDVFPGAVAPGAMLAWSPDTTSAIRGGHSYRDDTITGFSLTHFSGRGCAYKGDVPFKPVAGPVTDSPGTGARCNASFAHATETAACAKLRVGDDPADPTVSSSGPPRSSAFGSSPDSARRGGGCAQRRPPASARRTAAASAHHVPRQSPIDSGTVRCCANEAIVRAACRSAYARSGRPKSDSDGITACPTRRLDRTVPAGYVAHLGHRLARHRLGTGKQRGICPAGRSRSTAPACCARRAARPSSRSRSSCQPTRTGEPPLCKGAPRAVARAATLWSEIIRSTRTPSATAVCHRCGQWR
jgi:hypothetical protein